VVEIEEFAISRYYILVSFRNKARKTCMLCDVDVDVDVDP